jgi:hypothetical protein
MATAEEVAYDWEARKIILPVISPAILENTIGPEGFVSPELVMAPIHDEGSEAAQTV